MINPAEDIVNLYMQICKNRFTMGNVYVATTKPGRGAEIDLLSTDGPSYFWTEVSVSANPVKAPKKGRAEAEAQWACRKFDSAKQEFLKQRFPGKGFTQETVYSPLLFVQKAEEGDFLEGLKMRGIIGISFGDILEELFDKLEYLGYDPTSNILYLLKKLYVGERQNRIK